VDNSLYSPLEQFKRDSLESIASYQDNKPLQDAYNLFLNELVKSKYAYNFFWLGVPIIQAPQDLQALQEIIWEVKPNLIIETGIAWGGSLLFSASMLAILEVCGQIDSGHVIGVDIEIRPHNKKAILSHPLNKYITMLEGSSIDGNIINQVKQLARGKRCLVCLDSNHTHNHVLAELWAYALLVSMGSYCMVGDTGIEDLTDDALFDRNWGKGNSPKSAVRAFLQENSNFIIDKTIDSKLILTSAPDGYLKRVR
jgi:cephalosporin hydroxylase